MTESKKEIRAQRNECTTKYRKNARKKAINKEKSKEEIKEGIKKNHAEEKRGSNT